MAARKLPLVHNADELTALVQEIGFLPFVDVGIQGYSLHACTPQGMWFVKDVQGPWEWREMLAEGGAVAYGKFFGGKAGFISLQWLPEFVNWRRQGMDFDDRYADGHISRMEKQIMQLLRDRGPMLTRQLKAELGTKGFDGAAARLQMHMDAFIQRFEYSRDAFGLPYGMGVSRLAPAESVFPDFVLHSRMDTPPEASYGRIAAHILSMFPDTPDKIVHKIVK